MMKKLSTLFAVFGFLFMGAANAADITLYYSPSCPHCHHARDFFTSRIVYEYPDLRIVQINVMDQANLPAFQEALKKCEYDSGGVPVIVVGDKCFQGYADFMQQELRDAEEVGMSQDQKDNAAENKKALDDNADEFRKSHANCQGKITEYNAAAQNAANDDAAQNEKKNSPASPVYFYILLIVLVAALAFVLVRKDKKKK